MAGNKLIKFDFCQFFCKIKRKDKFYSIFDIENFISEINRQNLEKKVIEIYDGYKVRIEKFLYYEDNLVWGMRIFRLREDNLSYIVRPDEEAKPIELGDDEYLGEDMTMLFDVTNNVAMIQRNRFAVGFKNLGMLVQKILRIEGLLIDIRPISVELDIHRIRRNYFKSIEVRFANVSGKNTSAIGGALGEIIRTYESLGGFGGSFIVNLGRSRKKSLSKEPANTFLESIADNRDMFSAAILRAKDAEDSDIDVINLFDNVYSVFIPFAIPDRTSLGYEFCMRKMIEKYIEHKANILAVLTR